MMEKVFEALEDFKELKEVLANQKIKYAGIVNFNLDTIEQALTELKEIKEADPSKAMEFVKMLLIAGNSEKHLLNLSSTDIRSELIKIEKALIKAQEDKDIFVIYCSNNYHNYYMDYKGELTPFKSATLFDDELEAHKFLREHSGNKYDNWCVVNVKNLDDSRKCWNK